MRRQFLKRAAASVAVALVAVVAAPVSALESGDRVTVVVPYSPGGGFDTQSRLIAPYLESALRARGYDGVNVVVTNVRGGGGAIATAQVYAARPDGTTIMILDPESTLWQQTLSDTVFDMGEFAYLAQVSADPFTLSVRRNLELDGFAAAVERSHDTALLVATSGHGAVDHILPLILERALSEVGVDLGLDFLHFGGTSDKLASMRRNEAEMTAASTTAIRGFVEGGDVNIVLTFAETESNPAIQARDALGLDEEVYERIAAGAHQRRVLIGPPGMDDATVELFRDVLDEVLNDPDLVARAAEAQQVITYMAGADVYEAIMRELELAHAYGDYVKANVER